MLYEYFENEFFFFCYSFFFNATATTEIYTLSLHDALPISIKQMRLSIDGSFVGNSVTRNLGNSKLMKAVIQVRRRNCTCLINTGSPKPNLSASNLTSRDPTADHVPMTGV